ncbi:hypothetical protein HY58_18385 [Flavihumibacter sp. ZG627]|nr:hypothetical protein HY58_18385 [Flavihumibacter sp. ZG627]
MVFIEGKFYSIFSLLFGIGFSIILIRNEARGINPLKIFYRRLGVLLFIGATHILFIWEGDILVLYALIGLVLPLFRKCSNKNLLLWAALFLLSPILIDTIRLGLQWGPGDSLQHFAEGWDAKNGIAGEAWRTYLFKEGSGWHEWRTYQETAYLYRFSFLLNNNRIPKVLGMFLLGFYVGRNSMYVNLVQHRNLLKKLLLWGFVIGLPFSMAMAYFEGDEKSIYKNAWGMADTISYAFGVVPLSLAYVAFICLVWIKAKGVSWLNVFAPVGRMALTNYLMQTMISLALFYSLGLGLGQDFGLVYLFPIAIATYILQVLYSTIWFRYFEYGPLEWIWRQLTYGKRLALKTSIKKQ